MARMTCALRRADALRCVTDPGGGGGRIPVGNGRALHFTHSNTTQRRATTTATMYCIDVVGAYHSLTHGSITDWVIAPLAVTAIDDRSTGPRPVSLMTYTRVPRHCPILTS